MPSLLSPRDLSLESTNQILTRARAFRGREVLPARQSRRVLGLVFLEPSLRTRVGFMAAASRMGWEWFEVSSVRASQDSSPESWEDTLRTVAGYSDAIVARLARRLDTRDGDLIAPCPMVNGGEVGRGAHHPTQALIDLFAINELVGPIGKITLGIVGDPTMRAVNSLLTLLSAQPPARLIIHADPEHLRDFTPPPELESRTEYGGWAELRSVEVLYVAGIPHRSLPLKRREALLLTAERAKHLASNCVFLSPMPIIDEMAPDVKSDARNRMFIQSDWGLYVRMAILAHVAEIPL